MNVKLIKADRGVVKCTVPYEHANHVALQGPCPACSAKSCKVQGTGKRIAPCDRAYEADAVAACCNKYVGTLRVETNTLFGLREDEAVLKGRCRVY